MFSSTEWLWLLNPVCTHCPCKMNTAVEPKCKTPCNCSLSWEQDSAGNSEVSSQFMKPKTWLNLTAAIHENTQHQIEPANSKMNKINSYTPMYLLGLHIFVYVVFIRFICMIGELPRVLLGDADLPLTNEWFKLVCIMRIWILIKLLTAVINW